MQRRAFLTLVGGAAVASPFVARAQQGLPVIGFLGAAAPDGLVDLLAAFRRGLGESGFVERDNVSIDYRWAENDPRRLDELADELVRSRVSVIFAGSAPAAVAVAKATKAIPLVFTVPEDPVRLGLVASIARPGGNATGVNFLVAELAGKRLELLRTMVPTARNVVALLNPAEPTIAATTRRDVEAAAEAMGLRLRVLNASSSAEIDSVFATFADARPDALFVSSGPLFTTRRVQLAQLATRYAIPAVYSGRQYAEVGGLMTYGTNQPEARRQAAVYVGRILKGTKPADLPVVQMSSFELVINAQTARILRLPLPPSLLSIADEVIE